MAEEQDMTVDMAAFEKAMEAQRVRAREASSFELVGDNGEPWIQVNDAKETASEFTGYERDWIEANLLSYRESDGGLVELVFDRTPFYALSGGQVSDTGTIIPKDHSFVLCVKDVRDYARVGRAHICAAEQGEFSIDAFNSSPALLSIEAEKRRSTERNHSATHLLQAGLRKVLGDHIRQSGSYVDSKRLRFDFNHFSALKPEEIAEVEEFVNLAVIENHPVSITESSLDEARSMGAMSLFEKQYGDTVRVVKMGDISLELCGGTHVANTGRIGLFRIESESSVAAGIRRIEAVTGMRSYELSRNERDILTEIRSRLNARTEDVIERIDSLISNTRTLEKEMKRIKTEGTFGGSTDILSNAVDVDGVKVAFGRLEVADAGELKTFADSVRDKLGSGVGVLGAAINGKATIVVTVTDDVISKHSLKAGDIVREIAPHIEGSGGGRPHMAMAGGKKISALDEALEASITVVAELKKG